MTSADEPAGMVALGRLTPVDLQKVWPHEAHAFTPWLLANASVLGETLGMQLTLAAAEHSVGDFSLDLIGRDDATNEIVIVENQLTRSDHDHLGKLLTYAGGTDAVNVVWLARQFRSEHRAALEWLNSRTDENTRFFAVEIGAVRIGDSIPAPQFRLVVQPNDWGKMVKATEVPPISGKNLAYAEFWAHLLQRISDEALGWTLARKAPKANWLTLPSGHTGLTYYCSFTKSGLLCDLYFEAADQAANDARFAAALEHRPQLDAAFGAALSYEPLPQRKGCRIGAYQAGSIEQTDRWDEYLTWFITTQARLRTSIQAIGGLATLVGAKA